MEKTKSHSVMECYKADARIAELEARLAVVGAEADRTAEASMHVIAELEACLAEAEAEARRAGRDFQVARDAFDKSEANAGRLRSALEAVEWLWIGDQQGHQMRMTYLICPWCRQEKQFGHKPTCQRQAAIRAERQDLQDE